jgi:hypothetical protein
MISAMSKQIKTTAVDYFGEACTLEVKERHERYDNKRRHTFVSVSTPWNPEDKRVNGFTCAPVPTRKGDDPANDKLWRKYNKTEIQMQKDAIQMAADNGLVPKELPNQVSFSRTALCSCGCSPAFVYRDYGRMNYYISIISPTKELERKNRWLDIMSKREQETMASVVI